MNHCFGFINFPRSEYILSESSFSSLTEIKHLKINSEMTRDLKTTYGGMYFSVD